MHVQTDLENPKAAHPPQAYHCNTHGALSSHHLHFSSGGLQLCSHSAPPNFPADLDLLCILHQTWYQSAAVAVKMSQVVDTTMEPSANSPFVFVPGKTAPTMDASASQVLPLAAELSAGVRCLHKLNGRIIKLLEALRYDDADCKVLVFKNAFSRLRNLLASSPALQADVPGLLEEFMAPLEAVIQDTTLQCCLRQETWAKTGLSTIPTFDQHIGLINRTDIVISQVC